VGRFLSKIKDIFILKKKTYKFFYVILEKFLPIKFLERIKIEISHRGEDIKLSHPNLKIISESHDNYFSLQNLCI